MHRTTYTKHTKIATLKGGKANARHYQPSYKTSKKKVNNNDNKVTSLFCWIDKNPSMKKPLKDMWNEEGTFN